MKHYRLSRKQMLFAHHPDMNTGIKKAIKKIALWVLPVIVLGLFYFTVSKISACADEAIDIHQTSTEQYMKQKNLLISSLEAQMAECLNGGHLISHEGTVVDCKGVKTLSMESSKKFIEEQEYIKDDMVINPFNYKRNNHEN